MAVTNQYRNAHRPLREAAQRVHPEPRLKAAGAMRFGDLLDAILQINRNANRISGAPALAIGTGATTLVNSFSR
jgi:hypothetical protein